MILHDEVIALDMSTGAEIASMPANVYYQSSALEAGGGSVLLAEQLRAMTAPWDWNVNDHMVRWRGRRYTITGVMQRRRYGRDHHVTLNLAVITPGD